MTGVSISKCRLLVADDQPQILDALGLLLEPEGFELLTAHSPAAVLELLSHEQVDGVLIDLNYTRDTTSGREGLDLIAAIQERDSQLPIIVMTAWANIDLAVEAMRRGARDFIQKPWDNARVLTVVRTQLELYAAQKRSQWLEAENRILRAESRAEGAPEFIATAAAMRPVVELLARIGPSGANVLVTGEHGTGKEVVAQTLHRLSPRAHRQLVAVNTGALPEGTFESEIFGHVKGAFTDARTDRIGRFELANGSTLFLDEIANIPLRQQAKLLRVLETGELERVGSSTTRKVDVRMISATNADLRAESEAGTFRSDLYFRLNTVEIHVPPLRERREDIPALAAHFLSRYAARYRRAVEGFEPAALQMVMSYGWPGNVRELDHTMERAVLMARSSRIELADLGLQTVKVASQGLDEMSLEQVEAVLIRKALARSQGNVSHAADALGLSRGALYRRIEKYGI
ncbi:DNA-binding NtrC family response regulator [Granulicella aggregans]|uniref:DNA-binding NtrC family response regulator n=1 Tax=Granulicella aggregans TaxID=474949 RepID=A0A7W7ZBI0_9BACT|nr:sigma-54 dependent transcriptional regulator [Granulicella aggregans]MBB5056874.1 DNA-binding NtrC family response regulator [Granulicella aggregans]